MRRILFLSACLVVVLCLAACGKTVEISDTASDIAISDYEEISFTVKHCNSQAVTYTVCSSKEDFMFYEGHQFACVQRHVDGAWYPLLAVPQNYTGVLKWCSIPIEEQQGTISITTEYGGKLEKGLYRLVADCSLSAIPPSDSEQSNSSAQAVYLAAEFEID